jgi:hypothetical protein
MPPHKGIFISDAPITRPEDDLLGFSPHVDALYQSLNATPMDGPVVVGVYGTWGSGKTSFMELLRQRFGEDATVWMNAWAYDRREAVWTALIRLLMRKIASKRGLSEKLKDKTLQLSKTAIEVGGGFGAKFATHGLVGGKEVQDILQFLKSDQADPVQELTTTFRDEFESLVDAYLGKSGKLVVFLDDLDRCTPDTVVEVFQALKLFLTKGRVVYVLGIDPVAITQSLQAKYPQAGEAWARGFLEKIVDMVYQVPQVDPRSLLGRIVSAARVDFSAQGNTGQIATAFCNSNPRRGKRFIRAYQAALLHAPPEMGGDGPQPAVFAFAIGLRTFFPGAYKACVESPVIAGHVFQAWAEGKIGRRQPDELLNLAEYKLFANMWEDAETNHTIWSGLRAFNSFDQPGNLINDMFPKVFAQLGERL